MKQVVNPVSPLDGRGVACPAISPAEEHRA